MKLQNMFFRQLKCTNKVNVNNINYFKIPSRMLYHIVCNNYNMSCVNIRKNIYPAHQQPLLKNEMTKRYGSTERNNFACTFNSRIASSVILCNGERHVKRKTCNWQSYSGVRYLSSTNIDSVPEVRVPMQFSGIFKTLSESEPIKVVQDSLLWMHDYTGLPWWLVIVLTTVIMRATVTLPLSFYQQYILAKLENLKLEMNEIVKEMKAEMNYGVHKYQWSKEYSTRLYSHSVKKQWNNLIVRENCHPAKASILVLVQIPLWISLSISIRNLCYMLPKQDASAYTTYQEFTSGGFLWITDLTAADPFVLPIAMGLFNLAIIEITRMNRIQEPTKLMRYMTHFFRIIAIGMVPVAMYAPSCVSLYWATSSAFGLLQNLALLSPKLRRLARVPVTASESSHPYSLLRGKIISSLKRKMEIPPKT